VGKNKVFSPVAVQALRTIKYCALVIIGFVVAEEVWIMLTHGDDDPAGAVFVGLLITFGSIVIATAAAMFQQILQSAVELKHENDLTV
jgi:TRAP-type C4-dicarboxylate transport system permease small subunit